MGEQNEKNVSGGQQATNKPWEKPGQSSQNLDQKPVPVERKNSDNKTA